MGSRPMYPLRGSGGQAYRLPGLSTRLGSALCAVVPATFLRPSTVLRRTIYGYSRCSRVCDGASSRNVRAAGGNG